MLQQVSCWSGLLQSFANQLIYCFKCVVNINFYLYIYIGLGDTINLYIIYVGFFSKSIQIRWIISINLTVQVQ